MSRVRSVALCPESEKLMDSKANFSMWVREALLREDALLTGVHTGTRKQEPEGIMCNPLGSKLCSVCWPYGKPNPSDWRFYASNYRLLKNNPDEINQYDELWISEQAKINNPQNEVPEAPLIGDLGKKEIKQTPQERVGVLRRIFRVLW